MTSNSQKLSISQIVYIAKKLLEKKFYYEFPYDDYSDNESKLKNILNFFGLQTEVLDVEFFAKFIDINRPLLESNEMGEPYEIPKLKDFVVDYDLWGPATVIQRFRQDWESYDKRWVQGAVNEMYGDSWNPYDGESIDYEFDNFENDNFEITNVRQKIKEGTRPKKTIRESVIKKIVMLDESTLIELKKLIDKKLGLI